VVHMKGDAVGLLRKSNDPAVPGKEIPAMGIIHHTNDKNYARTAIQSYPRATAGEGRQSCPGNIRMGIEKLSFCPGGLSLRWLSSLPVTD